MYSEIICIFTEDTATATRLDHSSIDEEIDMTKRKDMALQEGVGMDHVHELTIIFTQSPLRDQSPK